MASKQIGKDYFSKTNTEVACDVMHNMKVQINSGSIDKKTAIKNDSSKTLTDASVVIAAITSCTNTSNPNVLIAAGLLAKKAVEYGLVVKSFVKTSLAPGSRTVEEYLISSGLQEYLNKLGFNIVGFGCTTCIGNSGPLKPEVESQIQSENLNVAAVLSGNRNFEGRVHQLVKANYLASPQLVVAYAIAGTVNIDLTSEPIGVTASGKKIYLKDITPTKSEINEYVKKFITRSTFVQKYANLASVSKQWHDINVSSNAIFTWDKTSSYIENPPYFTKTSSCLADITIARPLAIFGDSITTDHISPAGDIAANSPAGEYLKSLGIARQDFNSYGARRGSHSVMMRGTFANIRIKNKILGGKEGGLTKDPKTGETMSIYDMATRYEGTPLIVFAGKEYGTGSSRDWAAKGTKLLGVRAVVAKSFERIHRSNLIGMGVLPFIFAEPNQDAESLGLDGTEQITIANINQITPKKILVMQILKTDNTTIAINITSAVNTEREVEYLKAGGIMNYVLRSIC